MPDNILDDIEHLKLGQAAHDLHLAAIDTRLDKLEAAPAPVVGPVVPPTITDAQLVQALKTLLLGGAATIPVPAGGAAGGGGTVVLPADANQYPFAMPSVPAGNPVILGVGPDDLDLLISNSPGQINTAPCTFNVILKRADGSEIGLAGPLTCTSYVGQQQQGAQHFSIRGVFGPGAQFIIAGAAGGGVSGMFLMGASLNLIPLGIWGQINSRGGDAGGGEWTYNSNGNAMALSVLAPAGYTAPVPAPTDTFVTGNKTLAQLAQAGAISLPAGTFVGTAALTGNVIGAGMGQSIIDASNHPLTFNKAILVPTVPGITIKDLRLTGAKLNDALGGNGAGIRDADNGIGFTAENAEIDGCDNGILTFGSDITLNGCKFHDNGNAADGGHTHNVYVGGNGSNTLNVNGYTGYGAKSAHDIKSRAKVTKITSMNSIAGGQGRCLDVPDGGTVEVNNSTWEIPAGAADRTFFGFATENTGPDEAVARNGAGGTVTLNGVVLVDNTGIGGQLFCGTFDKTATLNLVNCTYKGAVAPAIVGWGTVNGSLTKAG